MTSPLLTTFPLGHLGSTYGSHYDMDTLIVHYDERLRAEPMDGWSWSSARAHEGVHWIQHHATSVGAFLTGIRFAQQNLFRIAGSMMSFDAKDALFHWRRERGPIVSLDEQSNMLAASALDGDSCARWLRMRWFRLQQVYMLFCDTDTLGTANWTVRPVDLSSAIVEVADAYESVDNGGLQVADLRRIERMEARHGATNLGLTLSKSGRPYSVRDLLEACCLVAEAHHREVDTWYAGGEGLFTPEAETELNARLNGSSRAAELVSIFRAAVERSGFIDYQPSDILRTFALLGYVALNPPLPPYRLGVEWARPIAIADVLPTSRFFKLCEHLLRIGLYRGHLDNELMWRYVEDACDAAALPPLGVYEHACASITGSEDEMLTGLAPWEGETVEDEFLDAVNTDRHRTYIVGVQKNFHAHRQRLLPFIVLGDGARNSSAIKHEHPFDVDEKSLWTRPVVSSLGDDLAVSEVGIRDLALNVVTSAAIGRCLFKFMADDALALDAYPASVRGLENWAFDAMLSEFAYTTDVPGRPGVDDDVPPATPVPDSPTFVAP